jgi:hypothetical protein
MVERHDLDHYKAEIDRPTHLGEAMTIVGHPFAQPVTNDDLLRLAIDQGLPEEQIDSAQKAIEATGFTTRFLSHLPDQEPDMDAAIDRTVAIGAMLLREAMTAHGWDKIDVFIDTAAFLPLSINQLVLEAAGIHPDGITSRTYRYACAGAVGAFIDTLADPDLADARVVIAALEPLSTLIDRTMYLSPKDLSFPSIFGDAYTALAFHPNRFHLDIKDTLIIPDGGVIKLNTMYDFNEMPSEPQLIPPHYRFAPGGEDIFRYSTRGAFLRMEPTGTETSAAMDGIATGLFFGNNTAEVIENMLETYGNKNLLNTLNGKNIVMHPASKPVVDRIAKLLHRRSYLEVPHIPFLMDDARLSNGSSATTFNRLRYMIDHDLIDPQLPMMWIAPGIGSAIAGAIGSVNP